MKHPIYDDIKYSLNNLQEILNHIEDSKNQVFELLNVDIIFQWHRFNELLTFYVDHINLNELTNLLLAKDYFNKYKYLANKFCTFYLQNKKSINVYYGDCSYKTQEVKYRLEIDAEKDADIKLFKYFYAKLDDKENLIEKFLLKTVGAESVGPFGDEIIDFYYYRILDDVKNEIHSTEDLLDLFFKTFMLISSYDTILKSGFSFGIQSIVEKDLRDYSRQVYKQTERDLRHEAQKFKERRNAPLTPEVWGYVLENENRAIELARDGKLTSEKYIDDEHYEGFSDETKKQMEESFPLMQKILDIGMDDSLFDLEYGLESHVNLLSALNVHNLDVFHELVLRHNIIRCGACPELRESFEQWVQGEEVDTDRVSVATDNNKVEQEEFSNDSLIRFVFDDNDREKVIKGLKACKDSRQVATFARRLWVEEVIEPDVLRSVEFHRAIIPLLKFDTSETALKQAIIKQIPTK